MSTQKPVQTSGVRRQARPKGPGGKAQKPVGADDLREKIKEVYEDCLEAMGQGKECDKVSRKEKGLDDCKPFGEEGWKTVTWDQDDQETAIEKFGEEQYEETLKCLRGKAIKIALNRQNNRPRTEKPPSGEATARSKKRFVSSGKSGFTKQ